MQVLEKVRVDVILKDHEALDSQMRYLGITNEKLARRVGVHKATIAHLRRGARRNASPKLAADIEEELRLARGSLFRSKVFPVSDTKSRAA